MNIFKLIKKIFKPQSSYKVISKSDLLDILCMQFAPSKPYIALFDLNYICLSKIQAWSIWQELSMKFGTFKTGEYDCDDFAIQFTGEISRYSQRKDFAHTLCIGFCTTSKPAQHALNWFVDENNKFYFLEPQNGAIFPASGDEVVDILLR